MLRPRHERRQERAAELALGLLAHELRGALDLGLPLREVDGLLHRALAPLLDRLWVAHHLDVRTVLLLGHLRELGAHHLGDDGVELVDVRRPEQDAGKPALRHAAEVALRRLGVDLLRVVVVAEVRRDGVVGNVLLARGRKAARLALEERLLLRAALCAGRDLEQHRLRVVEEEVGEVLELVGVDVVLQLADDRAERLRLGQYLHLDVERTRALGRRAASLPAVSEGLAVAKRLAVAVAEGLAVASAELLAFAELPVLAAARLAVAKGLAVAEGLAVASAELLLALRTAVRPPGVRARTLGTKLTDRDLRLLLRPVGREVEGTECAQVDTAANLFAHGLAILL